MPGTSNITDIITIRVPKDIANKFKEKAALKGISVNTLGIHAIEQELRGHHKTKDAK